MNSRDATLAPQPSLAHSYVARSNRMAYLAIPKAGCTSLINMLHMIEIPGFESVGTAIHREASLPRAYAPTVPRSYFRFTFVRNPYLRLLSFYHSKVKRFADPDPNVNRNLVRMGLHEGMAFDTMVSALIDLSPSTMDLHCAPQHLFVEDMGVSIVDFVGRIETLADDWAEIERRCSVQAPLLLENRKSSDGIIDPYSDHRVAEQVYAIYRRDFELFGYQRDPERAADS